MKNKVVISLVFGVIFVALGIAVYLIIKPKPVYIHNEGETQGTIYSATYDEPEGKDLQDKIEKRIHEFDMSISTYIPNSIISRINNNDPAVKTDLYFETMFYAAQEAARRTNGAIDITVGPLVKAWGFFNYGNNKLNKFPNVSEFLPYVGYKKIHLKDHKLIKDDPRTMIDDNSLGEGYSSDIVAELLKENGCKNYMVDIGGEVVCKGLNSKGEKWTIGINKPIDDSTSTISQIQTVIHITNCAVTTSGGYRKFYIRNGKKYSHIINPHTGYPIDNNMLSVTVVAPTGLMADTYDTPFMVIGVDSCLKVCKRIPGMDCYIIYTGKDGKNQVVYTEGFKKYLTK